MRIHSIAFHLHPGRISAPKMLIFVYHLYPGNVKPYPGHEICISPPKRFPLTCIQVAGFASQIYPGPTSLPFKSDNLHLNSIHVLFLPHQVIRFTNHLHLSHISSQYRSKCLCLTSIQVMSIAHPGLKMCVINPSWSCLTCIQIPISLSHFHPCTVSPPSRSEVSCRICIHVTSQLH